MKRTRVCDMLGIEYPIIQGGMAHVSRAELVAAVSDAGGLGLIGSASLSPEELREEISRTKSMTEKSFGVNVSLLSTDSDKKVDVIIDEGVKVVFTAAGNPALYTQKLKDAGCAVTHVVPTVKMAVSAVRKGVDAVVCEGFEAGGHNGQDMITTVSLVPQVVDAVDVPVIAAGGITDPRGFVAALALGAEGVQIGTRFIATKECNAHTNFKKVLVDANDLSTIFIGMGIAPVRVYRNKIATKLAEAEAKCDSEFTVTTVGPGRGPLGAVEGDIEEGMLNMSQAAGLIKKVVPVSELIREFVEGYDRIVGEM